MQGEREREKESRGGGRKGITWNGTLIPYEGALTSKYVQSVGGGEDGGRGRLLFELSVLLSIQNEKKANFLLKLVF